MYKKSPPKDKKNVPNKDISMGDDIVLPVPKGLPEQQAHFSLVATSSSMPLPAQAKALIFSMESKLKDTAGSIIIPHQNLAKFLKHVGFGEQDEAENMLKQDPSLSLKFGDLMDCAEREFKKISAFQYALWALDFHMWQMILKYLPDKQARRQVSGLKSGRQEQTQVNWQNLINVLQIYIDNYDVWSYDKLKDYWAQAVGGEQLLLPAHVINEYHHPLRNFYSHFASNYDIILPRLGVDCWINANQSELMQLGENFAWARGNSEMALPQIIPSRGTSGVEEFRSYEIDKDYLKSLLLFRREQARMLIFILSSSPHSSLVSINDCKLF